LSRPSVDICKPNQHQRRYMITLEGLSQQQMQIAEMLWKCNSLEDVDRLVRNMPPTYRQDAVLVKELLIAAGLDEVQETDLADRALVDIFGR